MRYVRIDRPAPHVAAVTLDRPERLNALSCEMLRDLGPLQLQYRMQQAYGGLVVKMRQIPQPLIAAVNGAAAGLAWASPKKPPYSDE